MFALVDDEDFNDLNQWKWSAQGVKNGNNFYAKRADRKKIIVNDEHFFSTKMISMHRYLMGVSDPNIIIDHIDGNGLNNQKNNLRACTTPDNLKNRRSKGTKTSKFKGVTQKGVSNQWVSHISVDKKRLYLGTYASEMDAAVAYNIAAKEHHGGFANLNNVSLVNNPIRIKTFKTPNRSSAYRGVCFVKKSNKWQATIKVAGKNKHLGTFDIENDAAIAYNNASRDFFGDKMGFNIIIN